MTKFAYFNDTKRIVSIHPATQTHGTECDMSGIQPLEVRKFTLPEGTYAWVKMWDYGEKHGLQILVSPMSEVDDKPVGHEPSSHDVSKEFNEHMRNVFERYFAKHNPHDKGESIK